MAPGFIWFDNLHTMGTPNYYVQKMYSTNRGTNVVPILENGNALIGQGNLYASATIDKETNEVYLKMVNIQTKPMSVNIDLEGVKLSQKEAVLQILTADNKMDYNTIENPKKIYPIEKILNISDTKFEMTLEKESFTVLKIKYE